MSYVAYYRRKSDRTPCVRYVGRGFACTRDELPREMATRCGAVPETLEWDWISGLDHARELVRNGMDRGLYPDGDTLEQLDM